MNEYTRLFLHFLHALGETRRVSTFLFGTRLTNVTRAMRARDPDDALARCSAMAVDWSGGTRIGEAIARFNRDWSRRVLGQGAITLLITDGLERDNLDKLEAEMERLKVDDVLLHTLVTLINLGARKAGLASEPGAEPPNRDLEQTRQAIDGARALLPVLEARHGQELAPLKDALSRLQMAYVQLSGETPPAAEPAKEAPEAPGQPKSSGRLWIPGQ